MFWRGTNFYSLSVELFSSFIPSFLLSYLLVFLSYFWYHNKGVTCSSKTTWSSISISQIIFWIFAGKQPPPPVIPIPSVTASAFSCRFCGYGWPLKLYETVRCPSDSINAFVCIPLSNWSTSADCIFIQPHQTSKTFDLVPNLGVQCAAAPAPLHHFLLLLILMHRYKKFSSYHFLFSRGISFIALWHLASPSSTAWSAFVKRLQSRLLLNKFFNVILCLAIT